MNENEKTELKCWKSGCQKVHTNDEKRKWDDDFIFETKKQQKHKKKKRKEETSAQNDSVTNTHKQSNHYDNGFSGNIQFIHVNNYSGRQKEKKNARQNFYAHFSVWPYLHFGFNFHLHFFHFVVIIFIFFFYFLVMLFGAATAAVVVIVVANKFSRYPLPCSTFYTVLGWLSHQLSKPIHYRC